MTRAKAIPDTINIHVPFRLVKRGGRKEIHLPPRTHETRQTDETLVKALARAFRWKRILETGEFTTINELARSERIGPSYITRILRLTHLGPDILEAILDGRQGPEITLARLMEPFPLEWDRQAGAFSSPNVATG